MKRSILLAALALASTLTAACAAPTTTNEEAASTIDAPEATPAAALPLVQKTLVVGDAAAQASRRAAVAARYTGAAAPAVLTSDVNPFIASSGTYVVRPTQGLAVRLVTSGTTAADVATVVSSNPGVATAELVNGQTVVNAKTLGNAFVTAFDKVGNAVGKFMVLSATPAPGTAIVDDPSLLPMGLYAPAASGPRGIVTDFVSPSSPSNQVALAALVDNDARAEWASFGLLKMDSAGFARAGALAAEINGQTGGQPKAVYFPSLDVLLTLRVQSGHYLSLVDGGIEVGNLITQEHFEDYLTYGGQLSSSPLAAPGQAYTLPFDTTARKVSKNPIVKGVVHPDGTRIAATAAGFGAAHPAGSTYEVVFPIEGLGAHGIECKSETADAQVDWSTLSLSANTSLSAAAAWNHGAPSVGMDLHPQVHLGGQLSVSKAWKGTCEIELADIPVAEWGVPVFGNVQVHVPVKAELEVSLDGKVTIATPRFDLGSASDPTKPGTLGWSYSPGGGFKTSSDMKSRLVSDKVGVVDGSAEGDAKLKAEITAGISVGLGAKAEVKAWLFNAKSVSETSHFPKAGGRRDGVA